MAYRKVFGKDERKKLRDKDGRYIGDNARKKNFQDKMDRAFGLEPIIESEEVGSLETPDKVEMGNSTNVTQVTIPPTPPPVNNSTPLVQAKPPQVSEVDIKITEAPIPFRKLISSKKYLSVSDMNKSGLPPEIAKMIS